MNVATRTHRIQQVLSHLQAVGRQQVARIGFAAPVGAAGDAHLRALRATPRARRAFAAAQGKPPGGDIFIHGGPNRKVTKRDWTAGCVAVTDRQMETIYAMVKPGTPILILP